MKPKRLTVISLAMLILLVVGAFALTKLTASTILIAEQVKISPKPLDLENGDDIIVKIKLNIDDIPVVDEIDPATILLQSAAAPMATWTDFPAFYAKFPGNVVVALIWAVIDHMGITTPRPWVPVKVPLKIEGQLYDGTPWEGIGEAKVLIPSPTPPPPPPP